MQYHCGVTVGFVFGSHLSIPGAIRTHSFLRSSIELLFSGLLLLLFCLSMFFWSHLVKEACGQLFAVGRLLPAVIEMLGENTDKLNSFPPPTIHIYEEATLDSARHITALPMGLCAGQGLNDERNARQLPSALRN